MSQAITVGESDNTTSLTSFVLSSVNNTTCIGALRAPREESMLKFKPEGENSTSVDIWVLGTP